MDRRHLYARCTWWFVLLGVNVLQQTYALTPVDLCNTYATKGDKEALGEGAVSTKGLGDAESGSLNSQPVRINLHCRFGQGAAWTSLSPKRVLEAHGVLTHCDAISSSLPPAKNWRGLGW